MTTASSAVGWGMGSMNGMLSNNMHCSNTSVWSMETRGKSEGKKTFAMVIIFYSFFCLSKKNYYYGKNFLISYFFFLFFSFLIGLLCSMCANWFHCFSSSFLCLLHSYCWVSQIPNHSELSDVMLLTSEQIVPSLCVYTMCIHTDLCLSKSVRTCSCSSFLFIQKSQEVMAYTIELCAHTSVDIFIGNRYGPRYVDPLVFASSRKSSRKLKE